jgi:hypothetical protein
MGFISNQWLNRGQGLRNRKYRPVPVVLTCERSGDAWSRANETRAEFTAKRTNGEVQAVHLSQAEIDSSASVIVGCMSAEAREVLVRQLLGELSRAKLLRVLAFDLRDRVRLPKK